MKRRLDSVDSKLVELLKANAREATASLGASPRPVPLGCSGPHVPSGA